MKCLLCGNTATGISGYKGVNGKVKEIEYCDKHKTEVQVAINMIDDDVKAVEKLINKYKSKNKDRSNEKSS